jgi:hypothetical protein
MRVPTLAALLLAASLAAPALAQTTATPAAPSAPAAPSSPKLVTASVKLDGGWRASKFVGAPVYDGQNQKIGSVDDLILDAQNKAAVVIVSVGGFLGIGDKLVAIPFDQLTYDQSARDPKVLMQGASKDTLAAMPSFTYGG